MDVQEVRKIDGYLKKLFGKEEGIEEHLTYSIQFLQLAEEQMTGPMPASEVSQRLLSSRGSWSRKSKFSSPRRFRS